MEYVTDACAVYVGFGNILMQGIEVTKFSSSGLTVTTTTKYIGYLEKWQIAYLRNIFYNVPIPLTLRKWFTYLVNVAVVLVSITVIIGLLFLAS